MLPARCLACKHSTRWARAWASKHVLVNFTTPCADQTHDALECCAQWLPGTETKPGDRQKDVSTAGMQKATLSKELDALVVGGGALEQPAPHTS